MEEPGSPQTSRKRQQQEESNDTHVHQYRRTQVTGLATSCRHIAHIANHISASETSSAGVSFGP